MFPRLPVAVLKSSLGDNEVDVSCDTGLRKLQIPQQRNKRYHVEHTSWGLLFKTVRISNCLFNSQRDLDNYRDFELRLWASISTDAKCIEFQKFFFEPADTSSRPRVFDWSLFVE